MEGHKMTLNSFLYRCWIIEIDAKISKDKVPILLHDDSLDRTTNGSGLAIDYNYDEIKKLDAGKSPTTEEIFKMIPFEFFWYAGR